MTLVDARTIAERLGLPQEAVRKVQRHGFLRRLDLDEREIKERLWHGHLVHTYASFGATSGSPTRDDCESCDAAPYCDRSRANSRSAR